MTRSKLNKRMGDGHERHIADLLGGYVSRGSGNQWRDQMDGRLNRLTRKFAFAWDGKSTLAKSISVTREMWEKARDQAGGERPMLGLRFYDNERLDVGEDLVVLKLDDFAELLEEANKVQTTYIFVNSIREEEEDRGLGLSMMRISGPRYSLKMLRDGKYRAVYNVRIEAPMDCPVAIFVDDVEIPGQVDIIWDGERRVSYADVRPVLKVSL